MTSRTHEPIPRLPQPAADRCAEWSYERLRETRVSAARLLDSGFAGIHERTHLEEIIDRIDATISLKRQRDEYRTERK
jgi:hypothetical protein